MVKSAGVKTSYVRFSVASKAAKSDRSSGIGRWTCAVSASTDSFIRYPPFSYGFTDKQSHLARVSALAAPSWAGTVHLARDSTRRWRDLADGLSYLRAGLLSEITNNLKAVQRSTLALVDLRRIGAAHSQN